MTTTFLKSLSLMMMPMSAIPSNMMICLPLINTLVGSGNSFRSFYLALLTKMAASSLNRKAMKRFCRLWIYPLQVCTQEAKEITMSSLWDRPGLGLCFPPGLHKPHSKWEAIHDILCPCYQHWLWSVFGRPLNICYSPFLNTQRLW